MSSPYTAAVYEFPDRRTMSSPAPSNQDGSYSGEPHNVSARPMLLKVLYTFDNENKTNCLARWMKVLPIRTAYLDENTQIGVVELKTCIQAIVTASPELVAKLGQDYTVYAYDYSEYETPLVGQGMLSWMLASSSSTPSAPANQSRTMITGRVCKNILGLFSGGAQETLEVKLRLVPVPTCLQSEYIESMNTYRQLSKVMPEDFDPQAWTDFLQKNPGILSTVGDSRSQSPYLSAGPKDSGIEHVQRLMNDGYTKQSLEDQTYHQRRASLSTNPGAQEQFRSHSPAATVQSLGTKNTTELGFDQTRPSTSNFDRPAQSRTRRDSVDPGYLSNDDRFEEGPARKRAKVMKADWPTKSSFGKQVDSLRVAASTAASIRVFQPTAVRPSDNPANYLQEQPRAPTPVPQASSQSLRSPLPMTKSNLGWMAIPTSNTEYSSPYPSTDAAKPTESPITSPEDTRATYTPCDPASSPPEVHGRRISPTPSSPSLPPLPQLHHERSETMSATFDDLFYDKDDDDENRPMTEYDLHVVSQHNKRAEAPPVQQPLKKPSKKAQADEALTEQEKDEKAAARSRRQARNALGALSRTASSGSLNQTFVPASDPIRPAVGNLHRSQTWSGQQAPHPASDFPMGSECLEAPRPKSRAGWNSKKRKQAIQSKLATSIAAGEVPPFCDNCGAIETPTWRKAFSRVHSGGMELVKLSNTEGGIVACATVETNEDGTTKLFKIFKKSLLKMDKDFEEILLCNPCGLWLHNHKGLRPKSFWEQRKEPKRGGARKKSSKMNQSNNTMSETLNMHSEGSSPIDGAADEDLPGSEKDNEPELPPMNRKRAMSSQTVTVSQSKSDSTIEPSAVAALQRAIQSSPGRFLGTKRISIDLDDLAPKPTRRVLFPSPKHIKTPPGLSGCDDIQSCRKASSHSTTPTKSFVTTSGHGSLSVETADKENHPPPEDPFDDLFDERLHQKPSSCSSSPSATTHTLAAYVFKTPIKSPAAKRILNTGDFFSSAAKAFLHAPRTPSRTPQSQSRSQNQQTLHEMTPFSRQINSLLSDANNGPGGSPSNTFSPSRFMNFPPLDHTVPGRHVIGTGNTSSSPSRYFRSEDFDLGMGILGSEAGGGNVGVGMPSSPPGAWFGVYEDPAQNTTAWGDFEFGSSPMRSGDGKGGELLASTEGQGDLRAD